MIWVRVKPYAREYVNLKHIVHAQLKDDVLYLTPTNGDPFTVEDSETVERILARLSPEE